MLLGVKPGHACDPMAWLVGAPFFYGCHHRWKTLLKASIWRWQLIMHSAAALMASQTTKGKHLETMKSAEKAMKSAESEKRVTLKTA